MRRFKSPGHAQRFLAAFGPIAQHYAAEFSLPWLCKTSMRSRAATRQICCTQASGGGSIHVVPMPSENS